MKRTELFVLVLLCTALLATAPLSAFEKGTKGIGGSFYLGSIKYHEESKTDHSFTLKPQGSYFIKDNLCIDLDLSMGLHWSKDNPTFPSLGIGVGGRYFFKRLYGGVNLFFETEKMYHRYAVVDENGLLFHTEEDGTKWGRRIDLYLRAGYLVRIVKNIYLDAGLYYRVGLGRVNFTKGEGYKNEVKELGTKLGLAVYF